MKDFRVPLKHIPPCCVDSSGNELMLATPNHKIKNKWDEEYLAASIIANRRVFGRWYSALLPELYLTMDPSSGVLVSMSIPINRILPEVTYPGDIDILVIPYENNEIILSKALAVEIKVLRARKENAGRSPNKFGFSQASALLENGLPFVAVGHLIVTAAKEDDLSKKMHLAKVGSGENITALSPIKVDPFTINLLRRTCGRLESNCPDDNIGFFATCLDINRIYEPLGKAACASKHVSVETLKRIEYFYNENYYIFNKIPRYSDKEISHWESIKNDKDAFLSWDFFKIFLKDKRVLTSRIVVASIEGNAQIMCLYKTDREELFLTPLNGNGIIQLNET